MLKNALILFFVISPLLILAVIGFPLQSTTIPSDENSQIDVILNSKPCTQNRAFQNLIECYQDAREIQGSNFLSELSTQLSYARKHYNTIFFMTILLQLILIGVILLL